MKQLTLLVFSLICRANLFSQNGCDINLKINSYPVDTVWFGHTFGKRAEPNFFALRQPDGRFHLQKTDGLPEGLYAIIYRKGSSLAEFDFMSVWLAEGQRTFSIETWYPNTTSLARVTGSDENKSLLRYLARYQPLFDTLSSRTVDWKSLRSETSYRAMVQQQEALRNVQEATLAECTKAPLTAALIRQTAILLPDMPDHVDFQEEAHARNAWMRAHFFDSMDIGSGNFLKYPLWVDKTDFFFSRLPAPEPDSMISMVEEVLRRLEHDTAAYRYYFRYMLSTLNRMVRYRTDEVFVYFVRNYLDKGKIDWLSAELKEKFLADAERMETLFYGYQAPNAVFYDSIGRPVSLYEKTGKYTLLMFWMHDCNHCKTEIPIVERLYNRFKSKGLQVFSVCCSAGEGAASPCFDFARQMQLPPDWAIVHDPLRRSRFNVKYNVRSYPRLILIDAQKRILFKHAGEAPEKMLEAEFERAIQ